MHSPEEEGDRFSRSQKFPLRLELGRMVFPLSLTAEGAEKDFKYWKRARESDFLMYFKVGEETNGLSRWCSGKEFAC